MTNFYKGGRGLFLPEQNVETIAKGRDTAQCIASLRNRNNPQNNICAIPSRRDTVRRGVSHTPTYANTIYTGGNAIYIGVRIPFAPTLTVLILLFVSMFGLVVAQAQSPENGEAAEGQTEIKPLTVGDTMPGALWNLPLQVINHPDGKETITMNDYRDKKLIILDFWATWCGSCISAFPKVKLIENELEKDLVIIPVTSQLYEKVSTFLTTNEAVKPLNMWSVVNAKQLARYFNIFTLPHYVWISNGRLVSFTTTNALETSAINSFLANGEILWNEKVELNKKLPFVINLKETDFSVSSFYYEGNLEGVGVSRGALPYGDKHTNYYFTNYTQHEVLEWFAKKVREEQPDKYLEIKPAPFFLSLPGSKDFLALPVNVQIIIFKDASLEEVFLHWLNLGRLEMQSTRKGNFEVFPKGTIKRKEAI